MIVLAATSTAACAGDTGTEPEDRDAVAALQLVVTPAAGGGSVSQVIVLANGQVTSGPLRIPLGRATIIARPLNDAGATVSSAVASTLRLTVSVAAGNAAGLTFARDVTTPLAGTLTATTPTAAGTTVALNVGAQRIADSVWPLGPHLVTAVVAAP